MRNINVNNTSEIIQIFFPAGIYVAAVFILLFIVNTDNFNKFFTNDNGLLVGSRWFSYQYTGENYFHPSVNKEYLSKTEALNQAEHISKLREFSKTDMQALYNIIDSFSNLSSDDKNEEKGINATELNIKIDRIK